MTAPVPVVRDRSGEPAAAFEAELARIEQAPAAAEGWATVEKVARAISDADGDHVPWDEWPTSVHNVYIRYALAAVLALDSPDAAAVRRCAALAEEWETEARQWLDQAAVNDEQGFHATALAQRDNACEQLPRAQAIRAAITGPTP